MRIFGCAALMALSFGTATQTHADDGEVKKEEVRTGITLIDPTKEVSDSGDSTITATGSVSLAKGDKFSGLRIEFKDPDGATRTHKYRKLAIPAPGETKDFKVDLQTNTKGKWTITVALETTGSKEAKTVTKTITIP